MNLFPQWLNPGVLLVLIWRLGKCRKQSPLWRREPHCSKVSVQGMWIPENVWDGVFLFVNFPLPGWGLEGGGERGGGGGGGNLKEQLSELNTVKPIALKGRHTLQGLLSSSHLGYMTDTQAVWVLFLA